MPAREAGTVFRLAKTHAIRVPCPPELWSLLPPFFNLVCLEAPRQKAFERVWQTL